MRLLGTLLTALALAGSAAAQTAPASGGPLPVAAFAEPASLSSADLSPNGQWVAGIKLLAGGEALIVADWRTGRAVALQTARYERGLELNWVAWKTDDRLIFSLRQYSDRAGHPMSLAEARANPERAASYSRVFAINRDGTRTTQLLQGEADRLAFGTSTRLVYTLPNDPENILLSADGDDEITLLFRVNVNSGNAVQLTSAPGWSTFGWLTDGDGAPVVRGEAIGNGTGYRYFRRSAGGRDWTKVVEVRRIAQNNIPDFEMIGAGPGANQVYVIARPDGADTAGLYRFDTATGAMGAPLFADPKADVVDAAFHPRTRALLLACVEERRLRCSSTDEAALADWNALVAQLGEEATPSIAGMSADASVWLVGASGPRRPGALYLFDRGARRLQKFVDLRTALSNGAAAFAPTRIVDYAARDGAALWAYFTEPAGDGAKPLVVLPHGGPEGRDSFDFDDWVQALATRGYAVLQPNFRGGSGFGRAFAAGGYGQWGGRMQTDIADAVAHMIAAGEVDASRICIVGGSFGGYAALAGVALEPDRYKCAVGINGVYDLDAFLQSKRREEGRGSLAYSYWVRSIGDPSASAAAISAASPQRRVGDIKVPVLLIGGVVDQTVPFEQSVNMDRALRQAGANVTLIRYEDEDHVPRAWDAQSYAKVLGDVTSFVDRHIGAAPAP